MYKDRNISKLNTFNTTALPKLETFFSIMYKISYDWLLIDSIFQWGHYMKHFSLLVARVWPQQCLNMLVFHLQVHTWVQGGKERRKCNPKFFSFWPHWTFKSWIYAATRSLNWVLPPGLLSIAFTQQFAASCTVLLCCHWQIATWPIPAVETMAKVGVRQM